MEEGYEAQITKLIDHQKKQIRELKRLQNENGSKAEQIARIQEKIRTLNSELAEKKKEYTELEEKVKQQKEKSRGIVERINIGNNNLNSDIDDAKIVEKFTSLLTKLYKDIAESYGFDNKTDKEELLQKTEKISKFSGHLSRMISHRHEKEKDSDDDQYAKSTLTAIGVKRLLEKDALSAVAAAANGNHDDLDEEEEASHQKGFLTTFRISNKTTFGELHEAACRFWGITQVDEYELTDEKMNKISEMKQKIDSFFKNSAQPYSQYLVYFRRVVPEHIDSKQATKIDIASEKGNGGEDAKKKENDTFQKIFHQFPGLKAYLEVDKEKKEEREKEIKSKKDSIWKINDNHCYIWTLILLLFIFTVVPLAGERSIVTMYYTLSSFNKAYGSSSDSYEILDTNNTFQGIYKQNDFYQFINNTLAKTVFYTKPSNASNEEGVILTSNSVIGGVRIRQMRVQKRDCSDIPESIQSTVPCYYMKYSQSIRETNPINLTNVEYSMVRSWQNDWTTWKDTSTLGTSVGISGKLTNYEGDGYTVDIPWGTSVADVQAFAYYLEKNNYISSNTRAIVISFTLYNEVGEFFIYNEMVVEVTPTGILYPSKLSVIPFRKSFHTSAAGRPNHATFDALRVICAVALNIFLLYRVICSEGKIDLKYLLKFQGILNAFIVVLCYVSVGYNNALEKDDAARYSMNHYLTTVKYIEMKHLATRYETAITIMGVICGLAITRLATILTMNSRFYMIITSLEEARRQILFYCMVLVPILFAFAVGGMSLLALQVESFNNFSDAFISILMFGLGQVDGEIFLGSEASTPIVLLFTVFYFFVTFFLVTVFAGIYIDNYRVTVMDYGYNFIEKESWTYRELVRWLLPKFVYNRLAKLEEKIKKRNKGEDGETENNKTSEGGKKWYQKSWYKRKNKDQEKKKNDRA